MTTLFDIAEGQRLKKEGMEKAASWPFDQPVNRARNIAIMLAKKNGETHADDVYRYLEERLPEVLRELSPNSWGSIFKSPRLKFSGRYRESERVARHCGVMKIWTINEDGNK